MEISLAQLTASILPENYCDCFICTYVYACVLGRRANATDMSETFIGPSIKPSKKTVSVVSWKSFAMVSCWRVKKNVPKVQCYAQCMHDNVCCIIIVYMTACTCIDELVL